MLQNQIRQRRFIYAFLPLLAALLLFWPPVICLAADDNSLAAVANPRIAASLSAGMQHSAMINYDSQLYVWGDNTYGQLGFDGEDYSDSPRWLELSDDVIDVSLGAYHTLVVLADGSVWSFGRNAFGQLGNSSTANSSKPVRVEGLPPIKAVAAGSWHSLALGEDGSVWAWGNNSNGQVGDVLSETVTDAGGQILGSRCTSPVLIISGNAAAIAAGGLFSLYLNEDGLVFAWGDNSKGQLGDGTTQSHAQLAQVPGLKAVTAITAGYQHSLAVIRYESHDELMSWGDDSLGQLGSGTGLTADAFRTLPGRVDVTGDEIASNDHIVSIQAGYAQSAAIVPAVGSGGQVDSRRQQLLVWGSNANGQLALGPIGSQNRPTAVSGTFNHWIGRDFLPFDAVALGGNHMLVLSSKGLLAAAGHGDRGQLGNLSILDRDRLMPVTVADVIRPVWLEGCQIAAAFSADGDLAVRWPAAQDNRVVSSYRLRLASPTGTLSTINVGNRLNWTFSQVSRLQAYEITVMACDADSVDAADETLSRLVRYVLPVNADAGAFAADYFSEVKPTVWQVNYLSSNWQPDPQNLVRPLEVPWDTSSIYGDDAIERPADWQGFKIVLGGASLLALLMLLDLWRRKARRRRCSGSPMMPCRKQHAG